MLLAAAGERKRLPFAQPWSTPPGLKRRPFEARPPWAAFRSSVPRTRRSAGSQQRHPQQGRPRPQSRQPSCRPLRPSWRLHRRSAGFRECASPGCALRFGRCPTAPQHARSRTGPRRVRQARGLATADQVAMRAGAVHQARPTWQMMATRIESRHRFCHPRVADSCQLPPMRPEPRLPPPGPRAWAVRARFGGGVGSAPPRLPRTRSRGLAWPLWGASEQLQAAVAP